MSKSVGPSDRRIPVLAPYGRSEPGRVGPPREGGRFRRYPTVAAVAALSGTSITRLGSDEIPKPAGGESPISGPVPADRGCWRGDNPAGFQRSIEQRVSFLIQASRRAVLILPTTHYEH